MSPPGLIFIKSLVQFFFFSLCCRSTPFTPSCVVCLVNMLFDKDHSSPSTPSNPHTHHTSLWHFLWQQLTACRSWGGHVLTKHLATGSELLSWGTYCWNVADCRSEVTGCSTVSMNRKVLKDLFFVCFCFVFFAQLKLLTYSEQKARLLSCMSVVARITANNLCLQNATGAAWLYPASLYPTHPNLPPICISSFFTLPLCNPLTTLLCFSAHSSCMSNQALVQLH